MITDNDELKRIYRVAVQHGNLVLLTDLYMRCAKGRLRPADIDPGLTLDDLQRHAQQHRITYVRGLLTTINDLQNGRTTRHKIEQMVSDLEEVGADPAQAGLDPATLQTLRYRAYDTHAR